MSRDSEMAGSSVKIDFNGYQLAAARTAIMDTSAVMERLEVNPEYLPLLNFSLGLAGESGEVADEVKKVVFHGHPLDTEKVKKELGDALWYWSQVARVLELEAESIAVENVAKLMKRYPDGFSEAASIARADVCEGTPCSTCNGRKWVQINPGVRGLKPCPVCVDYDSKLACFNP